MSGRYDVVVTHKPRVQRLDWIFSRDPLYFITACTEERRKILATPSVHRAFVTFATAAVEHGVFVGRYVIMPDHLHMFVAIEPDGITLSTWMKSLKNHVSKELRSHGVPAPHWQKGFFDHVLRSSESYDEKWQYVLQNPVRAGLVARSEDWPYQGEVNALEVRRSNTAATVRRDALEISAVIDPESFRGRPPLQVRACGEDAATGLLILADKGTGRMVCINSSRWLVARTVATSRAC